MLENEKTNPPILNNTSLLVNNGHSTSKIDTESLSLDVRDQYLDQLYRQYNIEVNHALLFYIASHQEPMIFVDKAEVNVGRGDARGRITPEFDLSYYGGSELGVSRLHSRIVRDDNVYLIQDLGSTNYTWLNGQRMIPYQWYQLDDGHTLQFGKLATTVFVIERNPIKT